MRWFSVVALLFVFSLSVRADTVYLTSLSWPPYADKSLDEQGAAVAVAKAAFAAEGHTLIVDFFPWSRAVKMASTSGSKYSGYFPEYSYETEEFVFSDEMGQGPLGLVQNKAKPVVFSSVDDLKGKKIGVVQDYVNTEELDAKIASGQIKAEATPSDSINVRKVAGGRIDAAVIDKYVLKYLLATDKSLKSAASRVEFNQQLLQNKKLFIAFRNDEQGKKWRAIYNQGLTKVDVKAILAKYLD